MSEPSVVTGPTRRGTEVRQFPCKQCGANLEFRPGQVDLQCPYCGHREHVPSTPQEIREYDLLSALNSMPRTEGWGVERQSLHCENCGATTTFAPGQVAGKCAFCGSGQVTEKGSAGNVIRPETLIPFLVTREHATQLFRKWLGSGWFRPNALKTTGELTKLQGAYLPYWTFDALASASWAAEAGFHYYVTETYEEEDENGNVVTRTREVQHTRWEPAWGTRQDFFDDELVCASTGLPPNLLFGIAPFSMEQLAAYDPSFLAGFVAEEYQIDLRGGWDKAEDSINGKVYSLCAGDVPGDTYRNLHVDTAFSQMTFKHLLLPVWIAAYHFNNQSYRFLVNGQTGRTAGEAPVSWWKVIGAVLVAVVIIVIVAMLMRGR
jgi:DNA-directed RNA polymerase subunit RPC12/RpoP